MTVPLLPSNATDLERTLEAVQARIDDVPTDIASVWNPQTCPAALLPWLAWSLSIDEWDSTWPDNVKRNRVAAAIQVQRYKGTAKSVKDVVAAFGGEIGILEWWEMSPPGAPHTFAMTMTAGEASLVDSVVADIERVKPLRSHFTFTQALQANGSVGVAGGFRPVVYLRANGLSTPV